MGNKHISGIYGYYDNLKDKIVYVGQSKDIHIRHTNHMKPSNYNGQTINRVLQNTPQRYELLILKECDTSKLDYWETTLISLFNPKFNYNNGGCGNRGFKHSNETKEKLRLASTGRIVSLETRRKISQAKMGHEGYYKGKHLPQYVKDKISKANKGKKRSMAFRKRMSEVHKGRKLSEEHKRKIGESGKGRKLSPEHIEKLRQRPQKHGKENHNFKHYARVRRGGKKYVRRYNCNMQYYELVYDGIIIKSSYRKEILDELCDDFNKNNGTETFDKQSKIWGNQTLDKYLKIND